MATKKEVNAWLKEEGLTLEQVDAMFKELAEVNHVARNMIQNGLSWTRWNMSVIKQIPGYKEKGLEKINMEEEKKKLELYEKQKKEAEENYYWNHFLEIMVDKIDKKEKLTEEELRTLMREYEIDSVDDGEDGRWQRYITSVFEYEGRLFAFNWAQGLTESQDDSFDEQPFEVIKTEKTIVVVEYLPVNKK